MATGCYQSLGDKISSPRGCVTTTHDRPWTMTVFQPLFVTDQSLVHK
jgi:hypothetical protein